MADVKVPLKFEIYKGDELVREETLNQDVIKVGKLASSHLRIDDETVSRMHAVIEVTGPDDVHIIDLGSTRGTLVNGEHINKASLQSGDEIMFGESRVIVSFLEAQAAVSPPPQAAAPGPRGGRTNAGGFAPPMQAPPPQAYVPPPQQAYAPPPQQAYAPPPSRPMRPAPAGLCAAAGTAVRASAGSGLLRGSGRHGRRSSADVEVHDGTRAMEVQTIFREVVIGTRHLSNPTGKSTHGQGTAMLFAGIGLALIALITFVATAVDVGREKTAFEEWQTAGKESKTFPWKSRSAAPDTVVSAA